MPLFFIPAIFAIDKLAYRLGQLLGAGAAHVAGRGVPPPSTPPASKSAWIGRCILSAAIVVGAYYILTWMSPRLDSIPWVLGSWFALLILPRPTPRLFLMIARFYVMGTTITTVASLWFWASKRWPIVGSWDGVFVFCWWSLTFAMFLWAFLALRRKPQPNRTLVQVIPRPVTDFPQPPSESFERVEAETSHTHASAGFAWATRSTRVTISAQVRMEKQILSVRPGRGASTTHL